MKSDIFSKDVTRWLVYFLKILLSRRCFSKILSAQINYLPPKRVKLMPTKFNFVTYGYWDIYLDKAFVSFKDRFMTEGVPSLILCTLKNSDQMPSSYLFKVSNKDTGLIWATCSKLTVMSLEQYYHCSGIFVANCEQISHLALVFLWLWTGIVWLFNKTHVIIIGKLPSTLSLFWILNSCSNKQENYYWKFLRLKVRNLILLT